MSEGSDTSAMTDQESSPSEYGDMKAFAAAQEEAEREAANLLSTPEAKRGPIALLEKEEQEVEEDDTLTRREKDQQINVLRGTTDEARQQQLDALLARAACYSNFVQESQVVPSTSSAADAPPCRGGGKKRKKSAEGSSSKGKDSSASRSGRSSKKGSSDAAVADSSSKGKGKKKAKRSSGDGSSGAAAMSAAANKMERSRAAAEAAMPGSLQQQPRLLTGGTLKPYQLEGFRWLCSLYENGLSGILADEMGLGKTIQVIALLAHLQGSRSLNPVLIAAPLATLPNWISEIKKWAPSLPVILYHGDKKHRAELRQALPPPSRSTRIPGGFPIVVTSYEVCIADRAYLEKYTWLYLVVDEGQRVKNVDCRLVRELTQLDSESRLLLSGTPIQNTLEELWSLLHFVNPEIFDSVATFRGWFGAFGDLKGSAGVDEALAAQARDKVVSKLHDIVRPFLLRRTKTQVLGRDEMPPKREIVVYSGTTKLQRDYLALAETGQLREALLNAHLEGASEVSLSNKLMVKRKVVLHPFLYGEPRDKNGQFVGSVNPEILVRASGKMGLLDRLLKPLKAGGHKVLIFSQMTMMLDILQDYVTERGWQCCRIDGTVDVHERQRRIVAFNNDPDVFIFLLSTRAGGLGINLTAADTCIIYDSDWNPHQDSQAQDRCHRIGQTRPVVVYRLITAGTVEIGMLEKQIAKKKLERMAVQGGDFRKAGQRSRGELTVETLKKLLTDDVADLARRTLADEADRAIDDEELAMILDRNQVFAEERHEDEDIADKAAAAAAAAVCGREDGRAPFATATQGGGAAAAAAAGGSRGARKTLPRDGRMYDVVEATASIL